MKIPVFFLYDYVFPNFILPNATPPEIGVINYLHTLYSNKLRTESFFDINLETPSSNMKMIFDEQLGTWPNSVQHNGSYFKNNCMHDLIDVIESSVYYGKKKGHKKYIYSIKVTPHFTKFTGKDWSGSKLNGEYFWKHISAEVLNDAKQGNATILLEWCNESVIDRGDFQSLNNALAHSGIPKNQIILVMNGLNSQKVYESWFPEITQQFLVRNISFLAHDISHYYAHNPQYRLTEETFSKSKDDIRKYHFTFPNRRNRPYRVRLLLNLYRDGLLEKGNWSLLSNIPDHAVEERFREFISMVPHNLEEEQGVEFFNVAGNQDKSSAWNLSSYFYIASETFMDGEYKAFTEKVFKPLVNFQPFVFAAFPGALEHLRNMGFKTFHPFIDESYDNEPRTDVRLEMLYHEVQKLCGMSKEELHNWYWQMEDILVHNHRHALTLYKYDDATYINFFRELGERCV